MSPATKHFIRHYAEMVVAMFAGMAVLMLPTGWALDAVGTSMAQVHEEAPALMFLWMAVTMTAPMVAWMRFRGHGRRANAEMTASMFLPTFAAIAILAAGLAGVGTLMLAEHVAMLLSMLGAMLLRPAEYTGHGHGAHGGPVAQQVAA